MKINVEKLNEKLGAGKARQRAVARAAAGEAEVSAPNTLRSRGATYRGHGYESFGDFMASGDFRRLIVRPDGQDGGTWTLKGVLALPARPLPVYMHGRVDSLDQVLPLLDRLLRKGDWHEDRYPSKEDL